MKLNKMLEIITYNDYLVDEYPYELRDEIAESILESMEKAGMLPTLNCNPNDLIFPLLAYQWESQLKRKHKIIK